MNNTPAFQKKQPAWTVLMLLSQYEYANRNQAVQMQPPRGCKIYPIVQNYNRCKLCQMSMNEEFVTWHM